MIYKISVHAVSGKARILKAETRNRISEVRRGIATAGVAVVEETTV